MKIVVYRTPKGYTFEVEKAENYETTEDVIKVCLQLETELLIEENEEEDD